MTGPAESYKTTPAPPSPIPVPYPKVKPPETQTGSRISDIEGESTDDKHRDKKIRTNVKDISIPKDMDKSTPSLK
jgi:hypothetical protein